MIPIEDTISSLRVKYLSPKENEEELRVNADLGDEVREDVKLRMASYQVNEAKNYNRKVKNRPRKVGDLILRNSVVTEEAQRLSKKHGLLAANWERPYMFEEYLGYGTYTLSYTRNGEKKIMKNKWNINNLKKYFV